VSSQSLHHTRIVSPNLINSQYRLTWHCANQSHEIRSATIAGPCCRIGKHQSNDVVVDDPMVSGCHAELKVTAHGYQLTDLSSTNGTWIQGIRINDVLLTTSTTIRVGTIDLTLELLSESNAVQSKLETTIHSTKTTRPTTFHGIVGCSAQSQQLFEMLEKVAVKDATVLIEGESGTGKEGVAEAIHLASNRAKKPFVILDCAAIPEALIESELFGHERGAFTGATSRYDGHFRQADGGTLFLDELGELPLAMQPKLLRVLESRKVRRVGGSRPDAVDVRVVAATNRNLGKAVNEQAFREDLYYRLSVVSVRLTPLRERPDDIDLLVPHFIRQLLPTDLDRANEIISQISDRVWERLKALPWRGNVRELKNFIERTMVFSDDRILTALIPKQGDANGDASQLSPGENTGESILDINLAEPFSSAKRRHIEEFERKYLLAQLAKHNHKFAPAARASGLDRMNFKRLVKKYMSS